MMLRNLLVGLPTMLVCMLVQVTFAFWSVRYYVGHAATRADYHRSTWLAIRPLLVATLAMTCGTLLQIVLWGLRFIALGEFDETYTAVYHSAVNFASLGYGDIVMSTSWKLLGPLEAVCGVLMLGMMAAALMAILQHMIKTLRGSSD